MTRNARFEAHLGGYLCFQENAKPRAERYLVEPESPVLLVAASDPDCVDALGPELGHGGGTGHLELPLLANGTSLASSGTPFVPMVPRNTHCT